MVVSVSKTSKEASVAGPSVPFNCDIEVAVRCAIQRSLETDHWRQLLAAGC